MRRTVVALGLAALVAAGCDGSVTSSEPRVLTSDALLRQQIAGWGVIPIMPMPAQDPALVALGRALFFDKELSGNRDISCATCHHPSTALGDGLSLPIGTGGKGHGPARTPAPGRERVPRNAPSLLNSGLGTVYMFWDGRLLGAGPNGFGNDTGIDLPPGVSDPLVAQAMLPVLDRLEMRGEPGDVDVFGRPNELAEIGDDEPEAVWEAIMQRLMAIPEYVSLFAAAFPGRSPISFRFYDAARALAAFQMETFTKARAPFDRFIEGDDGALTAEQKRGAALFFGRAQCGSCHGGPLLGGQGFANVGVPQIGPGGRREPPLDLGRAEIVDHDHLRFVFRIPPLRNVELTAPYMHNGAYPTLEAVVEHYSDVLVAATSYDTSQIDPALRHMAHLDDVTVDRVLTNLDPRLRQRLNFTDEEKRDLVAFLKSLTDPAARDLSALVPAAVPSGLPVQD